MSQGVFDAWAEGVKPRHLVIAVVVMLLLLGTCLFALAVMGPRLVREGSLLWFGTYTEGELVRSTATEAGAFKDGAPRYMLKIDYKFKTAGGQSIAGSTTRTDVRTVPEWSPGDPVGVFYDAGDPANSVAEHNLRIDVYALALFLPFISLIGIFGPIWYVARWRNWRQLRLASAR